METKNQEEHLQLPVRKEFGFCPNCGQGVDVPVVISQEPVFFICRACHKLDLEKAWILFKRYRRYCDRNVKLRERNTERFK